MKTKTNAQPKIKSQKKIRAQKRASRLSTIALLLLLAVGLGIAFYPIISDMYNSSIMKEKVSQYDSTVNQMDEETCENILKDAEEYNKMLAERDNLYQLTQEQAQMYENMLLLDDAGMMGYIEIPSLDTELPIYHGASEDVLQSAIGHLEWTSLPVGGPSTHAVFSGHRGLPTSMLFTDLPKLQEGDVFIFHVLNRVLTYEVDQIETVDPEDVTNLGIVEGQDYATLVTCTPYGVNTHRLLVRGHRVENISPLRIANEAIGVSPMIEALVLGVVLLVFVLIGWGVYDKWKNPSKERYVPRYAAVGKART